MSPGVVGNVEDLVGKVAGGDRWRLGFGSRDVSRSPATGMAIAVLDIDEATASETSRSLDDEFGVDAIAAERRCRSQRFGARGRDRCR